MPAKVGLEPRRSSGDVLPVPWGTEARRWMEEVVVVVAVVVVVDSRRWDVVLSLDAATTKEAKMYVSFEPCWTM